MIFYLRLRGWKKRREERHASFIPGKLAPVKMRCLINIYNEPVLMPPAHLPTSRYDEPNPSFGYVATADDAENDKASPFYGQ